MFEWEDREYINPRKKVFKNMDTNEILNLELQDDTDNILKESETPLNAHNLNLAQQELVDDMSKTYTGTNITAETVEGYGRINKVYRNCYTFNLEKSIVIAIFNSKNVANVNHLSTEILCG